MPSLRISAWFLVAALAGGCGGGDNLVLPNEGLPHAISVVKGANQTAPVGAALPDSVVVRVTDAMDRPVAGQAVAFAAVGSTSGSVAPDTVTTNADGRAGVRWTLGPTAGSQTLSATIVGPSSPAPLSIVVAATAGAGGVASFTAVRGNNQSATAGSLLPDSLVVRATDANGNPVGGVNVAWTLTGGGSVSAASTQTGPDGFTGVLRTLGPTAGPQTTTATASGAAEPIVFAATATVGAAGRLTVTTQPSSSAQSSVPFAQQPRLQVRDANGNPVHQAGLAVTASIASGPVGATLIGSATAPTDQNGLATFSGLGIGGSGGTYTLNFGGAGLQGVTSSGITIAAGAASQLSLAVQPSATAESGTPLTQQPVVALLDRFGNPSAQAGVPVTAAIASGGGTLGGIATRSTDASGRATFTDLSIAGSAGTRTLVFFSGSLSTITSNPITVTAAPVSATQSSVTASPTTITAGSGTSTITVIARDASGDRVAGAAVTLAVSGTSNDVSQPAVTDANGSTTATLKSTDAGTKVITATINGVTVAQTASVTVTAAAPDAAASTLVASPTTADPGATITLTTTVRDRFGNPVSGATVHLDVSGTGNVVVQPLLPTNGSGVATGTLTALTGGSRTITSTVNGSVELAQPAVVAINPPPVSASLSTVSADPTTIAASDGSVTSAVTVTVRDASGQPIAGAAVTLAASGTGNSVAPAQATSDASGVATFQFSSTVAETKTLTATANGTPIDQTATVTVDAGGASAVQSSANVPKGERNRLTIFTVQLRDAFRNLLHTSGGTVTASIDGKNAGAPVTVVDNDDGTYRGSYTPTASGHGADLVNIYLEGTPIGGSPYTSNL